MRAIDLLRAMNRAASPSLPESVPNSFIRERWARHVFPGGVIDRHYYELCVLSELRDRLRAGDVWVVGSRRYRSFEERLISSETLRELEQSGMLPIAVDADFDRFIAARRTLLDEQLTAIDIKAKGGLLPDVTLLAPGYRADINYCRRADARLMRRAEGYVATIVGGQPVWRDGAPTAALSGRPVRASQPTSAQRKGEAARSA